MKNFTLNFLLILLSLVILSCKNSNIMEMDFNELIEYNKELTKDRILFGRGIFSLGSEDRKIMIYEHSFIMEYFFNPKNIKISEIFDDQEIKLLDERKKQIGNIDLKILDSINRIFYDLEIKYIDYLSQILQKEEQERLSKLSKKENKNKKESIPEGVSSACFCADYFNGSNSYGQTSSQKQKCNKMYICLANAMKDCIGGTSNVWSRSDC